MTHLDRRRLITLSGAALLSACGGGGGGSTPAPPPTPSPAPPPPPPPPARILAPLKDTAAAKGLRFGTALDTGNTYPDTQYTNLLLRHCDVIVAENDMKWEDLRPGPSEFFFTDADRLVTFANTEGVDLRFHTLLWEVTERYPAWLESGYDFGADPAAEGERVLTEHIRTVARRYQGDMTSWDTVNEAVDPSTGAYRSTPLSEAMGGMEAVLDTAFRTAREELPGAQLVYNDYMSWGANGTHRDGVLRLLEGLKTRGTPIDALGLQSHVWGGNQYGYDADETAWRAFLDEVTGMGLDLVITELDVNDRDVVADIEQRDARIAEVTKRYLDVTLSYPQTKDIVVWNLVHKYSWMQYFLERPDGLQKRGLPFDDAFEPTEMAFAIEAALNEAPTR